MPRAIRLPIVLGLAGVACLWRASACGEPLIRPEEGKKVHVFVFAGQSNMEGRADGRMLSPDDLERLRRVQPRVQLAYNEHPLQPLNIVEPPADIAELYHIDRIFGPELFFGMRMAEAWPEERFLIIKYAFGATSLYGAWNPEWSAEKAAANEDVEQQRLYARLIAYIKDLLSGYRPEDYELGAMVWVQGEGDGRLPEAAATYDANLTTLITGVRAETGVAQLPFLMFEVGSERVVEAMRRVAQSMENVTLVPQSQEPDSEDFYEKIPNGHYNHEGMKKLGERFATEFMARYAPEKPS